MFIISSITHQHFAVYKLVFALFLTIYFESRNKLSKDSFMMETKHEKLTLTLNQETNTYIVTDYEKDAILSAMDFDDGVMQIVQ